MLSQSPCRGRFPVHSGEAVNLVVAKAPQEVTVPRVVGKKQERAEGELIGAGFAAKSTTRTVSTEAEVGLVLQQTPAGGTKAKQRRHRHDHRGRARGPRRRRAPPHDDAQHRAPPRLPDLRRAAAGAGAVP